MVNLLTQITQIISLHFLQSLRSSSCALPLKKDNFIAATDAQISQIGQDTLFRDRILSAANCANYTNYICVIAVNWSAANCASYTKLFCHKCAPARRRRGFRI
jgi:hypothetical protein